MDECEEWYSIEDLIIEDVKRKRRIELKELKERKAKEQVRHYRIWGEYLKEVDEDHDSLSEEEIIYYRCQIALGYDIDIPEINHLIYNRFTPPILGYNEDSLISQLWSEDVPYFSPPYFDNTLTHIVDVEDVGHTDLEELYAKRKDIQAIHLYIDPLSFHCDPLFFAIADFLSSKITIFVRMMVALLFYFLVLDDGFNLKLIWYVWTTFIFDPGGFEDDKDEEDK